MKLKIWLEWYLRKDESHKGEEPIRKLTDKEYADIFELDKEDGGRVLGSYKVEKKQAEYIQPHIDHKFDFDKYEYFISPYDENEE